MIPKPNENVIANKQRYGQVLVHAWRKETWTPENHGITDCGRAPDWQWQNWMWIEYRTLNPMMVNLCKRCWA